MSALCKNSFVSSLEILSGFSSCWFAQNVYFWKLLVLKIKKKIQTNQKLLERWTEKGNSDKARKGLTLRNIQKKAVRLQSGSSAGKAALGSHRWVCPGARCYEPRSREAFCSGLGKLMTKATCFQGTVIAAKYSFLCHIYRHPWRASPGRAGLLVSSLQQPEGVGWGRTGLMPLLLTLPLWEGEPG